MQGLRVEGFGMSTHVGFEVLGLRWVFIQGYGLAVGSWSAY